MPTATVKEYLSTSYRPDCEYLEGVLLERNVGEYDHGRPQGLLAAYLLAREEQWRIRAVIAQRVQARPNRFRVPDVCAVKSDSTIEQIFTHPPILCVEILSKDDPMTKMQERIDDYRAFGVPYVWLLNPPTKRAYVFSHSGIEEVKDGILRTRSPDIAVPLAELFE